MNFLSKWIGICAAFALCAVTAADAAIVEGIAAVVNNEVITYSEINEAVESYADNLPKNISPEQKEAVLKQARKVLLNKMVENALITQEAKRVGITVKDEEITAHIMDMLNSRNISLEQFKQGLAKEGMTYERYRKDLRDHLMKLKLSSREVRSKITITEEEIGEYYAKHRQVYEGKEAVKIRQILFPVPPKAPPQVVQKMKQAAEEVESKLKAGESFEKVMQDVAETADTHSGEDLGFIEKGTMLSEVDEVAFRLKLGETSPVIESSAGFHIIQVVDKRGAGIKPLEEVREEIKNEIGKAKMERKAQEWIEELRKRSFLEIKMMD